LIEFKSPELEDSKLELIGAVFRRSIVKSFGMELFIDPEKDNRLLEKEKISLIRK